MKKFLKIFIFGLISIFFILVTALFIFIKTFDINKYKPQIISTLGSTLNRSVDFKDISLKLSLKRGVFLYLSNLEIKENADFGSGDFFSAEQVSLDINILDFLLRRQIHVLDIYVKSPRIKVIRLKDGSVNVQTLAQTSNSSPAAVQESLPSTPDMVSSPPNETSKKIEQDAEKPSPAKALPDIFIQSIRIENAEIQYTDYFLNPPETFSFQQINLNIDNFSLTKPFLLRLTAAFLSNTPNINIEGNGQIDLNQSAFTIKDTNMTADCSTLSMDLLRNSIPSLNNVLLPDDISGMLRVKIKRLQVSPQGLSGLDLDVVLGQGKINFKEITPGVSLILTSINAAINNFSLADNFTFRIEAAYVSDTPNIFLDGTAQVSLDTQTFFIKGARITTDLSKISLKQLQESMAMLKEVPLPQAVKGHLEVITDELSAGTKGLISLKGSAVLTEGAVSIKEIAVPVEPIEGKCVFSESALKFDNLTLSMDKGKISFSGSLDDYLGKQKFLGEVRIESIDLSEVINQQDSAIKIKGFLSGSHKFEEQGLDPAKIISALSGDGSFEIKEGRLTDINILKTALDKISFFPNLAQTLEENLPERFKEKLQQKDTIITAFNVASRIKEGFVFMDSINVEADGFLFQGNGQIGFDGKYNLEGSFIIPRDLAAQIISIVPEMDFLVNDSQEIQFPLKISGQGDKVSFMPDIKKAGASIIKNKAKQELQKILEKVIDKEGTQTPTEASPNNAEPADSQSSPDSNSEEKSGEQQLIEGILNTIFKK